MHKVATLVIMAMCVLKEPKRLYAFSKIICHQQFLKMPNLFTLVLSLNLVMVMSKYNIEIGLLIL